MEEPLSIETWLQLEPMSNEVLGDAHEGFYLSLEAIRNKLAYLNSYYNVTVNYYNFRHLLFNSMDKQTYSSGTIEIELIKDEKVYKRLVGASTHNIEEFPGNSYHANTSKTLSVRNALLEFPAFGANLNKQELNRVVLMKRANLKTSDKIKDFQKSL